jgi:hypothetical protein
MYTSINKTAASNTSENSQLLDYFLLYFQTILQVTVQEPNCYILQETQARNKPDIPDSHQISMKGLYAFLAITVQTGHDNKPRTKLWRTTDKFYCNPFYSSGIPHNHFLKILKYLHSADNHNPPPQDSRSQYWATYSVTVGFTISGSITQQMHGRQNVYSCGSHFIHPLTSIQYDTKV